MAKTEMMMIAFANGGILPAGISGSGEERAVPAHEPVSVPKTYGEHLVSDRFAYVPEGGDGKADDVKSAAERKKLEQRLASLRADLDKAKDDEAKTRIEGDIAVLEKQFA